MLRKRTLAVALVATLILALVIVAAGCGGATTTTAAPSTTAAPTTTVAPDTTAAPSTTAGSDTTASSGAAGKTALVLASTTSTQDSGLFDVLIPAFSKAYPQYDIKVATALACTEV